MAAWYQHWFNSPYYHKLYFQRDAAEARAFIKRLLHQLQPPPTSRMLDVACGRGRHSCMLAAEGFDVTGFDLAPDNIAFAKHSETPKLNFYLHDMRLPFWINYFDYAFNFFTSFGYFATRREHENAVRTISQSLKPTGTLLFDYLNVHFTEAHLRHNEIITIDGTTYEIHRWQDSDHFYKRIIISDAALEQPLEFTEKVAKFSLGDFTDMLSYQHMQVTEVFGDYNLQPYDLHKTPRLILLAKKVNG
jgi:SAM-dependent methyltransferase